MSVPTPPPADAERTLLPIACSLDAGGMADRAAEFRALSGALRGADRTERALTLWFAPEPGRATMLEDLARRERECCPFLALSVVPDDGRVGLRIEAPADGASVLDGFARLVRAG